MQELSHTVGKVLYNSNVIVLKCFAGGRGGWCRSLVELLVSTIQSIEFLGMVVGYGKLMGMLPLVPDRHMLSAVPSCRS